MTAEELDSYITSTHPWRESENFIPATGLTLGTRIRHRGADHVIANIDRGRRITVTCTDGHILSSANENLLRLAHE